MNNFLPNKYTKWYYNIITSAKSTLTEGYTEKHHILPKSLGGDNSTNNLVLLTAREHYLCHLLLVRMTTGTNKTKMLRAMNAFSISSSKNPRRLTTRQYQKARLLTANVPAWNKGKTLADYTPEQQEAFRKMAETKRGSKQTAESNAKRSATMRNRTFTAEHLNNLSKALKGRVSPTKGMTHPKTPCIHCYREVAPNIMAKYHGDRCKFK